MNYVILYNNNEKSCFLRDRLTCDSFAEYMTGKEKYPVAIFRIRRKFKQAELFSYEEREVQDTLLQKQN